MKVAIVVLACMAAAHAQQFGRASAFSSFGAPRQAYRPQAFKAAAPSPFPRAFASAPAYAPAPAPAYNARVYNSNEQNANILKYDNEISPDGAYNYHYETDNGISAQEQGTPRNFGGNPPVAPVVAQGSYSYTSPEGKLISISYVADENGFQPQGDAIPTSPPIPPQIARALEYIARTQPRQ